MEATVVVLGHECPQRRELEASLSRMGLVVMSADAGASDRPPGCGDILLADLRGSALGPALLRALHRDRRPLVVLAGTAREALSGLVGRRAPTMVLSAEDLTTGLRVTLAVCAGIVEPTAPASPVPAIPGLSRATRRSSAAVR